MNLFLGEVNGTALLILLGSRVVANVVLTGTKRQNSGWTAIAYTPSSHARDSPHMI